MSGLQVPEIDLYQIGQRIWRRRTTFLLTAAACLLVTVASLHVISPKYTVSMSLAPVVDNTTQIGSSGLGALAKLGGIDLSQIDDGSAQFSLFVSALTSRDAADAVAKDAGLMRGLFPEQWSDSDKRWIESSNLIHVLARTLKAFLGIPQEPWHPPNGEQVYEILTDDLQVDNDPKSPIVTISIQSDRPEVARAFLVKLTSSIDEILRKRALDRANDYITYLSGQLAKVTVADYRTALVQHVFVQEQTRMMASANVSFAAQVFSGPSRSNKPTAPKGGLLLVFSIAVGAFLGSLAAVVVDKRSRPDGRPLDVKRTPEIKLP